MLGNTKPKGGKPQAPPPPPMKMQESFGMTGMKSEKEAIAFLRAIIKYPPPR
jgi:hypothetical protein